MSSDRPSQRLSSTAGLIVPWRPEIAGEKATRDPLRNVARTSSCSRSGSSRSLLLLKRARDDGQVLVTKSLVDNPLPFIGQAVKHREPLVTERLLREVHVLESERQRELSRELTPGDPLQLGRLPCGYQRAVANGLRDGADVKAQPLGKRHRGGDCLIREGEPGVVHQLQP